MLLLLLYALSQDESIQRRQFDPLVVRLLLLHDLNGVFLLLIVASVDRLTYLILETVL